MSDQYHKKLISFKPHLIDTLKLAVPISIGQVGHVMMGVVDNAMVGRLGPIPLAASAIANGVFFIILVVGIGITYAVSPLVAMSKSAGNKEETEAILHQSLLVNFVTTCILTAITFIAAEIIPFIGQSEDVAAYAIPYLKILSFSFHPIMFFQTYRQFIEGLGYVRPAMFITLIANVFNAFFNWVLIFGELGFPQLGLNGAGLATLLSRTLMAFLLYGFVLKSENLAQFDVKKFYVKPDSGIIKKILNLGIPSSIQYSFEVTAFVVAAIMVGWIDAVSLAAHQIAISLSSITYMVVLGVSSAGAINVGKYYGEKNLPALRLSGFIALITGGGFMLFTGVIFILFRYQLPLFYIEDPMTIEIAATLLIIAALFQVFDGTQAVGLGILRGLTDAKFPTAITLFAYWVVGLPVAYIFGFIFEYNVVGIWIGLLLGLATSSILLSLRFHFKSRSFPN